MKHWLVAALVCFGSRAVAQDALGTSPIPEVVQPKPVPAKDLSLGGVPALVGEKLKEVKAAAILTYAGKPGAAAYLPIWTWHTKDGTDLVEFPAVGYRTVQGARPGAFATFTVNLPGLSKTLFGSSWFRDHVTKSKFPPVFFGPALLVPLDVEQVRAMTGRNWKNHAAVVTSVRF